MIQNQKDKREVPRYKGQRPEPCVICGEKTYSGTSRYNKEGQGLRCFKCEDELHPDHRYRNEVQP